MDEIDILLTRGVEKIYPSKELLEKVLRQGKKLTLYQGFDPTGTKLHIGHAVGFRKLRQWQDLGHQVIFLIGDGTGQAGDPSGKKTAREKFYTSEELRQNGRDYVLQAGKIVRFKQPNPVKILYNGDWLNKLGLKEILEIAGHFSLQQMLERDLYQERLKSGITLSLREFLYPLLQGYDSVAMNADLELGGTDQTFNMLAGRTLVSAMQGREKFVMTVPLLTDSRGVKIGKTEGNVIGLTDDPEDFYGKIMSLGDHSIVNCFLLLTDFKLSAIDQMGKRMKNGENPMLFKKQLAFELTRQLNSLAMAQKAQIEFETVHQKKQPPKITKIFSTSQQHWHPVDLLIAAQLTVSKSQAKQLISQSAVEHQNVVLRPDVTNLTLKNGDLIKVGKTRFTRIKIT